jgi:hypothetical protein
MMYREVRDRLRHRLQESLRLRLRVKTLKVTGDELQCLLGADMKQVSIEGREILFRTVPLEMRSR